MYLPHGSPELTLLAQQIVQSLDLSIRADLQSLRDWYFDGLLISTAFVVIGLFMEGPEVVHETVDIFRPEPTNKPRWIALLALFGWTLIVLGVAGEGIAEAYVSAADGTLQTFNDILLTNAIKEAGDAATSAKTAREESTAAKTEAEAAKLSAGEALTRAHAAERSLAKAENDAGKAQALAASALTTATDASTRAGKSEASLGKAEDEANKAQSASSNALSLARGARQEAESFKEKLASAERDLDALRDRVQPRHISEEKKKVLTDKLSPCVGEKPSVRWTADAFDGQIYGQDFMDVFSRAGCPVGLDIGQVWMTLHLVGVEVVVHDGTIGKVPQFAQQVLKSLNSKEVGIPAKPAVDPSVPEGSFAIIIGAKE